MRVRVRVRVRVKVRVRVRIRVRVRVRVRVRIRVRVGLGRCASAPSWVEQTPSLVRPSAPRIGSRSTLTVRCTVAPPSVLGEEEMV